MSIAVLTLVTPPDRLFSPLETGSLTVWLSTNRARSEGGGPQGRESGVAGVKRKKCWEEEKD